MTENINNNISKIIIRLQLIRSFIALEEEEEIIAQIKHLLQITSVYELENIIELLKTKSYIKALSLIEIFIQNNSQISLFVDAEMEELKLEAKLLEAQINELSDEKTELEKFINNFEVRHKEELGSLILEILQLRKNYSKGTLKEEDDERDFNEYSKEYKISTLQKTIELTENEHIELKEKYRRASKLCHPDVVNNEQKELANQLFTKLNSAYKINDLKLVREILANLEIGNFFTNKINSISQKNLLKSEIAKLNLNIEDLIIQIQSIKLSDAYLSLLEIDNLDDYFANTKQKLNTQLNDLKNNNYNAK